MGNLTINNASINNTTGGGFNVSASGNLAVTLDSLSANGGANGLNLANTTGSFTVTGDGTGVANGSGGTIQNSTGDGISLTNASTVSLTQLNVGSTGIHGIDVNTVTNFTYQDASIIGAADGDDENSIHIRNLFGNSLIEDVRLDDINEFGIDVRNSTTDDGTTDILTIRRVSVEDHTGAGFGESGILAESQGTSNMTLNIVASTFTLNNNGALGVLVNSLGTSTLNLTVDNNTFNAVNAFGSGAIQVVNAGNSSATVAVTNNDINESEFISIVVRNDDNATSAVTISGNDIDADSTATGITDFGISVIQDENGEMTVLIDNNTFDGIGDVAIFGQTRDTTDGTGTLNITVTNNTNGLPVFNPAPGLVIRSDDSNTVNANITGNNFTGNGIQDILLRNDATFNLTQTSEANLSAVNNGDSVLVLGVINFGASAPPLP